MQKSHISDGGGDAGCSISTLSVKEKDMGMSSKEYSAYPDESELDLGLGLSIAVGGGKAKPQAVASGGSWDQYARILAAKDFSSAVSKASSSSSSSVTKANNNSVFCGTKRIADEPSSPPGRSAVSQVVGWPPVRAYRINSLVNNTKLPATEGPAANIDKCKSEMHTVNYGNDAAKKTSLFVKVNMDGIGIGRKVDLSAHNCYETLSRALDDMFRPTPTVRAKGEIMGEQVLVAGKRHPLRLLDGTSDFVLTYEDNDGDWMLVGDVPWEMFYNSAKRLRITRMAEANGIPAVSHERKQNS